MDLNYAIPSFLCVLGFGLVIVAGLAPSIPGKSPTTNFERQKSSMSSDTKRDEMTLYHYSRVKLDKLVYRGPPGGPKPDGLWFSYSKKDWLDHSIDEWDNYKKGDKLHLYSITFSKIPKLFVVKTEEDVKALCNKAASNRSIDWDILEKEGFEGVQLMPGAIEIIRKMYRNKKSDCLVVLWNFDIDSGCLWNIDKVKLKYEETVTV
jgi:hypothetical protein